MSLLQDCAEIAEMREKYIEAMKTIQALESIVNKYTTTSLRAESMCVGYEILDSQRMIDSVLRELNRYEEALRVKGLA